MERELTPRQREIFGFIQDFHEGNGYPPTIQEIRDKFRFASPQTVVDHLKALERKRCLRLHPRISRGIEITKGREGVPVLGQIAAGSPLLAVENISGHLPLGKTAGSLRADFALEVKGDSMVQAGILDKDHVLIQKTTDVKPGEIVAAMIDGEATVKRFIREKGEYYLKPENDRYAPLRLERAREDIRILGRVTGVFRKVI